MNFWRKWEVILRTEGYWNRCPRLSSSAFSQFITLAHPSFTHPLSVSLSSSSLFPGGAQSGVTICLWCVLDASVRVCVRACVFKAGWPGWAGNGAQMEEEEEDEHSEMEKKKKKTEWWKKGWKETWRVLRECVCVYVAAEWGPAVCSTNLFKDPVGARWRPAERKTQWHTAVWTHMYYSCLCVGESFLLLT